MELFDTITIPIIYDTSSPYQATIAAIEALKEKYTAIIAGKGSTIDHDGTRELRHSVFSDFVEVSKKERSRVPTIESAIIAQLDSEATDSDFTDALKRTTDELRHLCHTNLLGQQHRPVTLMGIDVLLADATKITLGERLTGGNRKDVHEYYNSVLVNALHTCHVMTHHYAARWLLALCDKLETRYFATPTQGTGYIPHPADTSHVVLSDELMALAERMAENVHEVWAATRIAQGWTYGETRDDDAKRHPCLIPYSELPESEKVYDRNTSLETLRLIISEGFSITKKQ